MKKTKIVATIGPASSKDETLGAMISAGVDVVRLNFSHGDHASHKKELETVRRVREALDIPVATMLDTQGPEIRTGNLEGGEVELVEGEAFHLYAEKAPGTKEGVFQTYRDLWRDVSIGQRILIDDGLIELEVVGTEEGDVHTKVIYGGVLGEHKGINVPGARINLPALTEKDIEDIRFGIEEGVDFIAASFIRKKDDLLAIRDVLERFGGESIKIIAKVENKEGIDNMDDIVSFADGIMVARGDMGVEIETERVPIVQKQLIEKSIREGIPVITATQMLDSMIRNPRPTRAEVADVANAIIDGTSAVMLSGETAMGKYPVDAVKTMARVAEVTEETLPSGSASKNDLLSFRVSTTNTVVEHAVEMADQLSCDAIVIATSTGYSSRNLSKFRPKTDVFAVTEDETVLRQMNLQWGVRGVLGSTRGSHIFEDTARIVKRAGYIRDGDLVIMVAGIPQGVAGSTNVLKVHQVTSALHKGVGLGGGIHTGRVRPVTDDRGFVRDFSDGDILVARAYHRELAPFLNRAGAFISEEEGLTSPSAIAGPESGTITVVGAVGIVDGIKPGDVMTVNGDTGEIFLGAVNTI
ncbi:MAG: pyruvate kinase [Peptoniphilus sp.]|nr:pyruvate kinase [Peptoniphilus sp.]MDD7363251.1 pyruvate kinase [Bacillota bacterium]MDY6045344.1 pyruvate kinase [Peptoniphilus sp.]